MGLKDAISAKLNTYVKDYKEQKALDKAANLAYEGTYKKEYSKARITTAVSKAKHDANMAAKHSTGGGALSKLQKGAQAFSGVPLAMDAAFFGEIPKQRTTKPQPLKNKETVLKNKATVIRTGSQTITISPTTHKTKKPKKRVETGLELYNPALFRF